MILDFPHVKDLCRKSDFSFCWTLIIFENFPVIFIFGIEDAGGGEKGVFHRLDATVLRFSGGLR